VVTGDSVFAITGRNLGVVINAYDPGTLTFAVNGTAGKTTGSFWSGFSDIRLKDLTGTYDRGLAEILALDPIKYFYKPDNDLTLPSDQEHIGLVAQEVEKVFPEAIEIWTSGNTDEEYLLSNNDPIFFAMLNAIQELQAQIDNLKDEIEELKRSNN